MDTLTGTPSAGPGGPGPAGGSPTGPASGDTYAAALGPDTSGCGPAHDEWQVGVRVIEGRVSECVREREAERERERERC